eukprot:102311-Pleurochrysis_carterae.AAC.1
MRNAALRTAQIRTSILKHRKTHSRDGAHVLLVLGKATVASRRGRDQAEELDGRLGTSCEWIDVKA